MARPRRDRPRVTRGSRAIASGVPSTNSAPLTSTEMRLANWNTRSMSCSISSTVTSCGQRRDDVEDDVALLLRHAGGRLVEQQHARRAGDRDGDLQQALLAVGQDGGALVHDVGEAEVLRGCSTTSSIEPAAGCRRGAATRPAVAEPLGDGEADGLQRREIGEQLVDLERARDAELDAARAA